MKVPSPAYRQEESRFVEPALFLSVSRSPLNPWVQGLRLASKASVRGKLRLRHAALSGCYRIRRCRGFAVYIRFDFHSFASKLAHGKSKRLCMAHLTGLVDINCGILKNLLYMRAMWNGIPEYIPGNQALFFCLTESIIMKPDSTRLCIEEESLPLLSPSGDSSGRFPHQIQRWNTKTFLEVS